MIRVSNVVWMGSMGNCLGQLAIVTHYPRCVLYKEETISVSREIYASSLLVLRIDSSN